MKTFDFFGNSIPYLKQDGDNKIYGDRNIEIPLVELFISKFPINSFFIEIGAVLPYWSKLDPFRTIYDPYDPYPHCIKEDCENINLTKQNVICISTIEHIGKEEYGNTDIDLNKAIRVFEKILSEAFTYFITVPIGYHKELDEFLSNYQKRISFKSPMFMYEQWNKDQWTMVNPGWFYKFNEPQPFANAIAFYTNILNMRY